jgi:broad specificity phosphatase PhoE
MGSFSFYFVRHAPVVGQDGIAYGREADIDLSCLKKFNAAARQLPHDGALWFASGFPRAQKTAQVLQKILGNDAPLTINEDFNEQNFGDLVGMTKESIRANPLYQPYLADRVNLRPPGGESVSEMVARVAKGLRALSAALQGSGQNQAVIVCHGGVILSAYSIFERRDYDLRLPVPHLSVHKFD